MAAAAAVRTRRGAAAAAARPLRAGRGARAAARPRPRAAPRAAAAGDAGEAAAFGTFTAESLRKLTVPRLKDVLRERKLKLAGNKADLIERILDAQSAALADGSAGGVDTAAAPAAAPAAREAAGPELQLVPDADSAALSEDEQAELLAASAESSPDFSAYLDSTLRDFDLDGVGAAAQASGGAGADAMLWDDLDAFLGAAGTDEAASANGAAGWDDGVGEGGWGVGVGGEGGEGAGGHEAEADDGDDAHGGYEHERIDREVHVGWKPSAEAQAAAAARSKRVRKRGARGAVTLGDAPSADADGDETAVGVGWRGGTMTSFAAFDEARTVARALGLRSASEYAAWCAVNAPLTMPAEAHAVYARDGWVSWQDFLGETCSAADGDDAAGADEVKGAMCSYEDAKAFARGLNVRSKRAWFSYVQAHADSLPLGMPRDPEAAYSASADSEEDEEWEGWAEFLGTWEELFYSGAVEEALAEVGEYEGVLSVDDFEYDGTHPDGTRDEEHDAADLYEDEGSDVVYAGFNGVGGGSLLSPEEEEEYAP